MGWPAECPWQTNSFLEETGRELLRRLVALEDAEKSQEGPPACAMAEVKALVMATPWVIQTINRETVSFYHRNNISALGLQESPECWGCAVLPVDAVFDFQPT